MPSLLNRIVESSGDEAISFAVIRRGQSDMLDVLSGKIVDVEALADIPLGSGKDAHDVLAMVPFRQVRERGYPATDDGCPLRCLLVNERETVPLSDALAILPRNAVPVESLGFDTSDQDYAEIVRRIVKDEIGQGEGSNFVIRRSFLGSTPVPPATAVLSWLRTLLVTEHGAHWTFAVHTPGHSLVGASPECHVSVRDGLVTMNPIAGTLRHPVAGPTGEDVMAFLSDDKENDELFMVVDEEMKMMSAICPTGGRIKGPYLKQMSKLSHTEYVLEGTTSMDLRDVLRATMFAPTVTGSPMENACAVIERYEEGGRGYYSGVLAFFEAKRKSGYASYELDAPILIRTAHVDRDGLLTISAGATLVRLSSPENEVAETYAKASGMLSALELIPRAAVPSPIDLNALAGVTDALSQRNKRLAAFWMDPQHRRTRPPFAGRTALVIDCEDQFTEMLAHQLRYLGMTVTVVRWNSDVDVAVHDLVVFGPGPGDARDSTSQRMTTIKRLLLSRLSLRMPLLAVCLSHQILAILAGLRVEPLSTPRQGVQLEVDVFGSTARIGFYNTFSALAENPALPTPNLNLEISETGGIVTALRGAGVASIQGHLESVLSSDGLEALERLINMSLGSAEPGGPGHSLTGSETPKIPIS